MPSFLLRFHAVIKPTLIKTLLSTTRLELEPGLLTFLLKPALLFGLLRYWQTRTHCCGHIVAHDVYRISLEAKYCDNDFVDEADKARSSSGVLILALGCDISATLEPLLKQNLSPGFTF